MKVLLYGDPSKVHHTLSQGLKKIGIDSIVASHGDGWKNYERDIDVSVNNRVDIIKQILRLLFSKEFKGYDVVQLCSYAPFPWRVFHWSIVTKMVLSALSKNNKKLFMGAFGDDFYWVNACINESFEYSFLGMNYQNDQKMKSEEHTKNVMKDNGKESFPLNFYSAKKMNGIIAGLYDYWLPYSQAEFSDKLKFIPFPINIDEIKYTPNKLKNDKLTFLIGSQKGRYFWKGLDWVCPILEKFAERYPNDIQLQYIENVPYSEYVKIMHNANVVVDQVYSMGQGMNALTAMAEGKVVMSGGEDPHYHVVGEYKNKPIINIKPDEIQIQSQIERILDNRNNIEEWGMNSRKYIEDHHDYEKIAKQYVNTWNSL